MEAAHINDQQEAVSARVLAHLRRQLSDGTWKTKDELIGSVPAELCDEYLRVTGRSGHANPDFRELAHLAFEIKVLPQLGKDDYKKKYDGQCKFRCLRPSAATPPKRAGKPVSPKSVASGKAVLDEGVPDLVRALEEGQVSVSAAEDPARLPAEKLSEVLAKGKHTAKEEAKGIGTKKKPVRAHSKTNDQPEVKQFVLTSTMMPAAVAEELVRFFGQRRPRRSASR